MPVSEIATEMLDTHPSTFELDKATLVRCIDACYSCAEACTQCADACLGEDSVQHLAKCIRLNLDCADICNATGRVLSRQTAYDANITRSMVEACIQACRSCGAECREHGSHGMTHCGICAEQCSTCLTACEAVLQDMS